ncbi:MAG: phosphotransferase [Bacteroidia bacterium]
MKKTFLFSHETPFTFSRLFIFMQAYIEQQFFQWQGFLPTHIETLPQAGSSRLYFRITWGENQTCVATYNPNYLAENEAFIYFSEKFQQLHLPVPQVFFLAEKKDLYFQSDEGNEALYNVLTREGHSEKVYQLYQKVLEQLANLQIKGHAQIDYNHCLAAKSFDRSAILYDLNYFLFYFVNVLEINYNKTQLFEEFSQLADFLSQAPAQYFMFRDFQSRNIMVKENEVKFIDYQGGMRGALQYDVVSLLWQAKAALPLAWKKSLLDFYFEKANLLVEGGLEKSSFYQNYQGYILIRILQTFGSYGFRGLFERRPYFLSAIPAALQQLKDFLEKEGLPIQLPVLGKILNEIINEKNVKRFQTISANAESKLVVKIKSFSYKKGIPADTTSNGGGFVFDCRSLHNPGRYEPYKTQTGRDEPVKQFLLTQSEMSNFLKNIYPLLDIAVQNYLERDFDSLMICFGCTGGQHRSVFAADSVASYLKDKYCVKIELEHRERGWEVETR